MKQDESEELKIEAIVASLQVLDHLTIFADQIR
jgi:hypothetical protein